MAGCSLYKFSNDSHTLFIRFNYAGSWIAGKYVEASDVSREERGEIRVYWPLQTPALMLEFAELGEQEITQDEWMDWIYRVSLGNTTLTPS